MGTRWLPARPFSAIFLYSWFQLVFAWCHRHYVVADGGVIRDSSGSFPNVMEITSWQTTESSATALCLNGPWCLLLLADVRVTSRILRSTGRRSHPPQCYVSHSCFCFCELQEITSLQTTVSRSYPKVFCTVGNAYDMLGRERDSRVYNSEHHQTGRKWLRNCSYTNKV
jgi:hypothetical protein